MTEPTTETSYVPHLPESLLAPLLQWTGEALRELKAQEVPPAIRPLLGFDRRGFGSAAARAQLRRALETQEEFRRQVFEAIEGRDEVAVMVRDWDEARAVEIAEAAAERDDLPLLASALVVARPEGWQIGIGVAAGLHQRSREARSVEDDRRAFDTQVAKAQEAQRRAEEETDRVRSELDRLAAELRHDRASRREREEAAMREAEEARRRVAELEAALAEATEAAGRAGERAHREAERADGLDAQLKDARADAARARAEAQRAAEVLEASRPTGLSREELDLLARASEIARRVTERGPDEAPLPPVPEVVEDAAERRVLTRRVPVELPPGVVAPSLEGLRAALARSDPAVVVDGYNVSMLAWGDEPPDAQRQRLCALLERLHLRTNRSITVVFDGADVEGVRPPRRPGVRVLFSAPGQEADEVVVREVRAFPLDRPVLVVSSDRRVQEEAEAVGATAIPSDVFIEFLRR